MSFRPNKREYYLNIAKEISSRSTCMSVKMGAIIVKDDQIIATGYVGAPRKTSDCFKRGECLRRKLNIPSGHRYELCRSVHAEMNALVNAARSGISILGSEMYVYGVRRKENEEILLNAFPCFICKKLIINSGIEKVISITSDGGYKEFDVLTWALGWKEADMLDDMDIYQTDYQK